MPEEKISRGNKKGPFPENKGYIPTRSLNITQRGIWKTGSREK